MVDLMSLVWWSVCVLCMVETELDCVRLSVSESLLGVCWFFVGDFLARFSCLLQFERQCGKLMP